MAAGRSTNRAPAASPDQLMSLLHQISEHFGCFVLYAYDFKRLKEIDLQAVQRLILVDVRDARRIGPFAELVDRDDVELHIYDHHPVSPGDIKGHYEVFKEPGTGQSF